MVALNRGDREAVIDLARFGEVLGRHPGAAGTDVLTGETVTLPAGGTLTVPARSVRVIDASAP